MSEEVKVEVLEGGGFKTHAKSEDGEWGTTFYAMVTHDSLQNLEGKILTLIDASFQDKEQRKAVKDIFRRTFWFDWVEHTTYRGKDPFPVGMPTIGLLEK